MSCVRRRVVWNKEEAWGLVEENLLFVRFFVHGLDRMKKKGIIGGEMRTPLIIRVPTRVIVPLTVSFRCVLMTSVLPGSMGASSA